MYQLFCSMGIDKSNHPCEICGDFRDKIKKIEVYISRKNQVLYFCQFCIDMMYETFHGEELNEDEQIGVIG